MIKIPCNSCCHITNGVHKINTNSGQLGKQYIIDANFNIIEEYYGSAIIRVYKNKLEISQRCTTCVIVMISPSNNIIAASYDYVFKDNYICKIPKTILQTVNINPYCIQVHKYLRRLFTKYHIPREIVRHSILNMLEYIRTDTANYLQIVL